MMLYVVHAVVMGTPLAVPRLDLVQLKGPFYEGLCSHDILLIGNDDLTADPVKHHISYLLRTGHPALFLGTPAQFGEYGTRFLDASGRELKISEGTMVDFLNDLP